MQRSEAAWILAENIQVSPPRARELAALVTAECGGQIRLEARATQRMRRWSCHEITGMPPVEFALT
jgi:hypothetical protein